MDGKKMGVMDLKRLALAVAGGLAMAAALCAGAAWAVEREWFGMEMMNPAAFGILALSGFFGAMISGRAGGMLTQALSGLGIMLALLGLNLALFGGDLQGLIPRGISLTVGASAGALAGQKGRKKTGHYYRPKSKYR